MLDVDEDEKLTGEEEFELLAGPLGLNDRRIVPEPVQFPDSDPLGASVAMAQARELQLPRSRAQAQQLCTGFVASWHAGSSQTRD